MNDKLGGPGRFESSEEADKKGVKTDRLVHRNIAKNKIFQRYADFFKENYGAAITFSDFEVHHIDNNRENNDIKNLVIISKAEHSKIQHWKIQDSWRFGIAELKRIGVKAPNVPELDKNQKSISPY